MSWGGSLNLICNGMVAAMTLDDNDEVGGDINRN